MCKRSVDVSCDLKRGPEFGGMSCQITHYACLWLQLILSDNVVYASVTSMLLRRSA